ncbi:MAG TPA: hypothetical protein DCY95_21260 [Algoriphagus sp.]|jgi:hypothetical protein|uniref:hypothetical protein n=1 Tax=unclassified Algoriphagus TaxID=2641541 RepID=UPI000C4483D0|nr:MULTISPECIES: hypothetical protein [unclassified Algoriphagus]MAL12768.1 hypothetical protein [Algoriphagus sp.]MAN88949.1 hypothetical protein [Algoriphagus sp.]QYH39569.1 hypothetical protein GYM62_12555 [Algoriphagus sp. NBT04N3]HAD51266.1 hypothetical protein [Algoriphagus sp.]HAH39005.1 hypothetical protein [Algoriphagus sp.]|tara:strand:- start:3250 stop:3954 length:705 start_codon:yes stop_codon:yes gene_type:complete
MKKFFVVVALLISNLSYGQISNVDLNGSPARLSTYSEIDGSPYLFEDWARADISLSNAGLKENVAYKFNIYENELEVINEAGNKIYLNKAYIEYAMLERPSIIIANGSNEGMLTKLLFKKGYGMISGVKDTDLVNVIAEGKKYTLVRKFQTDLVTPPKNSYSPTPGRMFVFEQSFYLIDSNNEVNSVRNRTNNIVKSLADDDQAEAKQIIKDNKLDLSREDHMVIFFQKLNQEA